MNIFTNQYGGARLGLIIPLLIVGLLVGGYFGVGAFAHRQTGAGEQTGFIVAVDTEGLIWKTTTVYIKTGPNASDTGGYCATDPGVIVQLQKAVKDHSMVLIHYTHHAMWSEGCQFDSSETIRAVEAA